MIHTSYQSIESCYLKHGCGHRPVPPPSQPTDFTWQLDKKLKNAVLVNMPHGFPFRTTCDGYGNANVSYDSYEFHEDVHISAYDSHRVTFAFATPRSRENNTDYLSWRVYEQDKRRNSSPRKLLSIPCRYHLS